MKFAHIQENGKLLGWYDDSIHQEIPTPNIQVSNEVWQNAIDNNHNKIDTDGSTLLFDFRTADEVAKDQELSYMNAVQNFLDITAQATKWDNMQSARSAAGIPLDGTESDIEVAMHDDAIKLARWYLKVWAYCYAQLDAINAGDREAPESTEAFIEELPKLA